jgi:hypothetical protein
MERPLNRQGRLIPVPPVTGGLLGPMMHSMGLESLLPILSNFHILPSKEEAG